MTFMTTGAQERGGMKEVAKKGKTELLKRELAFFVFFDGVPVNYWHDKNEAFSEYNRICNLEARGIL